MKYPAVGFTCLPVAVPRRTEITVSENQLSGMTKLSHEGWKFVWPVHLPVAEYLWKFFKICAGWIVGALRHPLV